MSKSEKDIIDNYKERIKRQNQAIKNNYDKVTATLPKGTVDRIRALGITINSAINESLLMYLKTLEESLEMPSEQSEIPLESFQNEKTDISTFSTDLPEIKRIKESEEMKELEDNKPSNEYLDIPELTGDEEVDNANFIKFLHEQQARNAKKRNNELII